MSSVEKVNNQKEGILSVLRMRGPSLPIHVAREIKVQPLFVSAFLSELKAENKVKISEMRVGSSPLYYLEGQEDRLGNFVEYLNSREREAFHLLREKSVLLDEEQPPVVRVALRAIKDFAKPVKVRVGGESKLVWRHFLIGEDEVAGFVGGVGREKIEKEVVEAEEEPEEEEEVGSAEDRPSVADLEEEEVEAEEEEKVVKKARKVKKVDDFSKRVRDYLSGRGIDVVETFVERKREFEGRVKAKGAFGKQEYYVLAKDKKNFSDNDLAVAMQKGQANKLPALGISSGDLNKKGREYLEQWGNLVRWGKIE